MSEFLHSLIQHAKPPSVLAPSLFGAFPPALQAQLRQAGHLRQFADGQVVQQRGDEEAGYWLIEAGQVRLGQFGPDGAFNAVTLLSVGESFGELALIARRGRVVDVLAIGKAQLRFIPAAVFERLLESDPVAMRSFLEVLAQQFHDALDLLIALRRSSGVARLARTLAVLVRDRPAPIRLTIGQQELADLIGTSRLTVNAALGQLERAALVRRGYGWIEVLDPAGLQTQQEN